MSTSNVSALKTAEKIESLLEASGICGSEAARVKALADRLRKQELTISVIGQFKRGKSTLVNALLEEKLLPVGIIPVTSAVTRLMYGPPSAEVHFANGVVRQISFDRLSDYISEQNNPDNCLGVSAVTLRTPSDFLKEGVCFVDTPGVGSIHQHNSEAAYSYVRESDAVIFMLSVDSPVNQIEIEFLRTAKEYAGKFYFAVNKIDVVEPDELSEYLRYCQNLLCGLMETENIVLFPVSAKVGTGLPRLKEKLLTECRTAVSAILERSAAKKLSDIIACSLSQLALCWNAMKMPIGKFDVRFSKLREYLTEVQREAAEEAAALCEGSFPAKTEDKAPLSHLGERLSIAKNEKKLQISAFVTELFGMEYHFDLDALYLSEAETVPEGGQTAAKLCEDYLGELCKLCSQLIDALNQILLYREESTYVVARRIDELNMLTRELKEIKETLDSLPEL